MVCLAKPGGTVPLRLHLRVWRDEDGYCTNVVLPTKVGVTIKAACENGCRSGTVLHISHVRGSDVEIATLYCWQLD